MTDPRARLLLIRTYLERHTDAEHPLTVSELSAHLECAGLTGGRAAVCSDLALLREYGMEISARRGREGGFFLAGRLFDLLELQILADMVKRSRVLTQTRTEAMLQKIGLLTNEYEAAPLLRGCRAAGCRKADSEETLQNIGRICEALDNGRKLSFVYRSDAAKNVRRQPGTEYYAVNPCLLACSDGSYYLVADHPLAGGLTHYRLDHMSCAHVMEEPSTAAGHEIKPADYEASVFSMAAGERRWVRLAFDKALLGDMMDRFGTDAPISELDGNTGLICAGVRVSPAFYGWVFQFGGRVRILAPDDVRETMLLMLEGYRRSDRGETVIKGMNLES